MINRLEAIVDLKFITRAFIDGNLCVIWCEYPGKERKVFEFKVQY